MKFVLASASPRRKELLLNIGIDALVMPSNVDESVADSLSPTEAVKTLAFLKATNVAKNLKDDVLVIGADTLVYCDGKRLGKPKDKEDATKMLSLLSGKKHEVYTGFAVSDTKGNAVSKCTVASVYFRELSKEDIDYYIKTDEPLDKAGAYGIQGLGSIFIEKIEGDYFTIVGLPLQKLSELILEEFGINLLEVYNEKHRN